MSQAFDFGNTVLAAAQQHPDRIAFHAPGRTIRYKRVRELAFSYASRMRELGVQRNARVCFAGLRPVPQICIALACALLGCSWIRGTRAAVANRNLGITHVIYPEGRIPPDIGEPLCFDRSWVTGGPVDERIFEGYESPDSIWSIAQSSGTTGEAKFMLISAGAQLRRLAHNSFAHLGDVPPVICSLMQPLSVYGMEYVFGALMIARPIVISNDLDFIQSAGVNMVIGAPAQYLRLCGRSDTSRTKIACAVIGGSHCREQLFDLLLEHFALVQYQFGCSELGRISTHCFGPGAEDRKSVGKPVASVEIQIVDDHDRLLPPLAVGILRMRSDCPIVGYVGTDAATPFRDGWFYSGDIGFLSENGALTVTGRTNDVVNFGGLKINANALDDLIAATEGVREGACFVQSGFSPMDELAVLIVPRSGDEAKMIAARVQANLIEKFGRAGVARRIYVSDAIPKSESGKIARHSLAHFAVNRVPFEIVP